MFLNMYSSYPLSVLSHHIHMTPLFMFLNYCIYRMHGNLLLCSRSVQYYQRNNILMHMFTLPIFITSCTDIMRFHLNHSLLLSHLPFTCNMLMCNFMNTTLPFILPVSSYPRNTNNLPPSSFTQHHLHINIMFPFILYSLLLFINYYMSFMHSYNLLHLSNYI